MRHPHVSMSPTSTFDEMEYPDPGGTLLADTDLHWDVMFATLNRLRRRYHRESNVYVSGGIILYYERGNPQAWVSPDVFVVHGITNHLRDNYQVWHEGKSPDFILEVTSPLKRGIDEWKQALYRDVLRVPELFVFDLQRDQRQSALVGYQRQGNRYFPIEPVDGRFPSSQLALHLEPNEADLKLWDPNAQEYLWTRAEELRELEDLHALVARYEQQFGPLPE